MNLDTFIEELFEETKNGAVIWKKDEKEFKGLIEDYNVEEEFDFIIDSIYYSIQRNYNLVLSKESDFEEEFICFYVFDKKNELILAYDNENLEDTNLLCDLFDVITGEYSDEREILQSILDDL